MIHFVYQPIDEAKFGKRMCNNYGAANGIPYK